MQSDVPIPEQMYNAIQRGDLSLFKKLLKAHPEHTYYDDGRSMWFSDAASAGKLPILKFLISTGVDINEPANNDSVPSPEGVIMRAAARGHTEVVRWMLDNGARINFEIKGRTRCAALVHAVNSDHLEVVKLLVERGAALNSCWAEMTPLDHALAYAHDEVAHYLRSVGGKIADEV